MSTEQAGAVVIQVSARDFSHLAESSGAWADLVIEAPGRFEDEDGGPPSFRDWRRIYWFGRGFTAVIFARAFLAARGFEYEVLRDTASAEPGGPEFGWVILTDYAEL